jgi:uncharacterized membrane protein YhaH (DUF805 family)
MFSYFFSPKGRFRRRDYWFGTIIATVLLGMGFGADYVFRGVMVVPGETPGAFAFQPEPLFLGGAGLVIAWPLLAMGIKRWHDRDKSGWWMLLAFIPIVNLYAYVSLFLLPGTRHLNRFGPDPREEERFLRTSGYDPSSDPS